MDRKQLCKSIYEVSHLTGKFLLRSGQTSNEYFDKYKFESDPVILAAIAKQMIPLIPKGTEVLAGLEVGGIPIATAMSLQSGLPVSFVRKSAKTYGTCLIAEGAELKDKKICIIEDVVTSGGQILLSAEDLKTAGANILGALCVIDREQGGHEKLKSAGILLTPLFSMSELKGE
jgi:orotate phosphoribosyltransferase